MFNVDIHVAHDYPYVVTDVLTTPESDNFVAGFPHPRWSFGLGTFFSQSGKLFVDFVGIRVQRLRVAAAGRLVDLLECNPASPLGRGLLDYRS